MGTHETTNRLYYFVRCLHRAGVELAKSTAQICVLAALAWPCLAQDQLITQHTLYFDLGRNLAVTQSGQGGLLNNWIFAPYTSSVGTCVWISAANQTGGGIRGYTLAAFTTADVNVTRFTGAAGSWLPTD